MHFDDILKQIGEFGRFQIINYIIICIPLISAGFHMLVSVFIQVLPPHRCQLPGLENDTYEIQGDWHKALIEATIPVTSDGDYSKCTIWANHTLAYTGNMSEHKCDSWVYDRSIFTRTFATDFNLVCKDKEKITPAQVAFMGGVLAGAFILGFMADYLGRKLTFLVSMLLQGLSGTAAAFAPEYYSFVFFRFLDGFSNAGVMMCAFVLGVELVGPSKRMYAGLINMYFFALGEIILALLGYLIRDWQYLELAISIPSFLYLSYWWLIPESARWLLANGKHEEAAKILRKAAKVNRAHLPEKFLEQVSEDEEVQSSSLLNIFRAPKLLCRTAIIFYNWCIVSMVYYGLSLNSGNLGGSIFLNFLVAALVEFPAYTACFTIDKLGRKAVYCGSMLLGGVACLCSIFVAVYADPDAPSTNWINVCLSMTGKFGATMAFAIVYVWSAEIYPTVVRNGLMGFSSTFARVGGMLAPVIANEIKFEGKIGQNAALIVFGGTTILAGLLSLLLPETTGRELPETIEQAEKVSTRHPGSRKLTDREHREKLGLSLTSLNEISMSPR
ncbi:organic cation transporter protein [Lingula anatina]|uniref:Organic cation transporter protein n=1 Tax=Lingula anatina TaxID=7574 RepID=A0A1S3KF91_LINAN|nr:organic cation transporter protein [Lingula anatina]|eukprot:XP_013421303.1 organic cation transporter protein [Lingula anatina]